MTRDRGVGGPSTGGPSGPTLRDTPATRSRRRNDPAPVEATHAVGPSARPGFAEAYRAWLASVDRAAVSVDRQHFAALRDQSPGRPVKP